MDVRSAARARLMVLLATATLLVGACSTQSRPSLGGDDAAGAAGTPAASTTTAPTRPVPILGVPGVNAKDVALDAPVMVKVGAGALDAVTVEAAHPDPVASPAKEAVGDDDPDQSVLFAPQTVEGSFSSDKSTWTASGHLRPATTYQVTATARGSGYQQTLMFWKFTTAAPAAVLHTRVNVFEGSTYGVGMPVVVQLTSPVDAALRPEIERRLTMTTSTGITGAWRWLGDSELHWRPQQYWPAGTTASLKIDFVGLDAGNGTWGIDGRTVNFAIGDAHISLVDASSHQMVVTNNGAVARTIPVSTGRDRYPTKSGVHVVMTREATHTMDSSTIGIPSAGPGGYRETVKWAERISNSGEFVHSAPWSVGNQGRSNVSHGCINISDSDGRWFFDNSMIGDVVSVINTPATLAPDNGYGDWQIPWSDWAN